MLTSSPTASQGLRYKTLHEAKAFRSTLLHHAYQVWWKLALERVCMSG